MRKSEGPWYRASRDAWYVEIGGKQVKLAEGKANKKAAEREFHRRMAQAPEALPEPSKLHVATVCDLFLAFSKNHHEQCTFDWYELYLQDFCEQYGRLTIADLKPFHVNRWVDAHAAWGQGSRRAAIGCVKRVFSWADDQGIIDGSPIRRVKKPAGKARDRILASEERTLILATIRDQQFRDFVFTMQETGARPGEVRKVTAANVNLDAGVWIFTKHKTAKRTGKPRIIYMTKAVVDLCRRLMEQYPEGPLFRSNRLAKPFSSNAVRIRFRNLRLKLPQLAGAIAYSYRHSFATDALERGIAPATVSELLGHTDLSMLSRYYSKLSKKTQHLRDSAEQARGGCMSAAVAPNASAPPAPCTTP